MHGSKVQFELSSAAYKDGVMSLALHTLNQRMRHSIMRNSESVGQDRIEIKRRISGKFCSVLLFLPVKKVLWSNLSCQIFDLWPKGPSNSVQTLAPDKVFLCPKLVSSPGVHITNQHTFRREHLDLKQTGGPWGICKYSPKIYRNPWGKRT